MLLQQLKNFEWLNEPQGVFFIDEGMKVLSNFETSFIENKYKNISQNNGHFFFSNQSKDFSLTIKWDNISKICGSEAGIMIRFDNKNYAKLHISYDKEFNQEIYSNVIKNSTPDNYKIPIKKENIYLQIKKLDELYMMSYSTDLKNFETIREFYVDNPNEKIEIGTYLCNPSNQDFEATLSYIDLK